MADLPAYKWEHTAIYNIYASIVNFYCCSCLRKLEVCTNKLEIVYKDT